MIAGLTGKPPVTEMAEEVDSTSTSVPKDCVDWSVALETVKGDADLLRVVAETFLEDSPRLLLALRQAIIEANFDDLKRLAHTLKGALGYFGHGGPSSWRTGSKSSKSGPNSCRQNKFWETFRRRWPRSWQRCYTA